MAYKERKLKDLPYAYDKLNGISKETLSFHHDKHYAGYVAKLNEINKRLEAADRNAANANFSEYGELKRKETFNASGTILHEIYFENMGGDGIVDQNLDVVKQIISDFGSVENWKADTNACATASLGWAILCYDPSDGMLHNFLCDSHHLGAVWGAVPIIALDVFEHAYYHDQGPNRGAYLKNFFENINWKAVNERYLRYVKPILGK